MRSNPFRPLVAVAAVVLLSFVLAPVAGQTPAAARSSSTATSRT